MRAVVFAGILATAAAAAQPPPTFKAGIDVVTVNVTVADRAGRFISGLRKDDFAVFEDGQAREIVYFENEATPVSVGILLDASGSMARNQTGGRLDIARDVISRLVSRGLDERDEWFFARFTSTVVVAQDWTSDRAAIVRPLRETRATGDTSLYDAIALSIPLVQEGRFQKKALLVISDEGETTSLVTRDEALRAIGEHDVRVRIVNVKRDAVTEMARAAEELRHQYLLGYSTTAPQDGRRHAIRVDVNARGARVSARRELSRS